MALLVWLPLNGNIKNLGLSNLKFSLSGSGITTDSTGKIGSCYKRASIRSGGRIASNTTINLNGSISMFCWAKVTACAGDTANGLVSNHSHANNTGFGITVKLVSASDFRISCSTGNGSSRTYMTYYGTTNIKDKWCHLGLTYNKTSNTLKLWVNGSCEYTGTYTNSSRADYIWIFDWSTTYGDATYLPACSINDVRIYDHCLSEDEIHELSLGKVAHWCLDENSLDGQNLITSLLGGGQCTISGNTVNISGTNSDTYFYLKTSAAMESGKLYKISCTGSGFPSSAVYNFPIAGLSNTGPGQIKIKNGYCSMIFTANDTCANVGTTIIMDDTSRSAGAGTISNLRLVKLNKSCDISGNHYDLTVNGNPTLSNDSARYNKSTLFNGDSYLNSSFQSHIGTEDFTISCWAKIASASGGSSYQGIVQSKSDAGTAAGFGIYYNALLKKLLWSTGDGSSALEKWTSSTVDTILLDNWCHIVMVRNNSDAKKGYFYINGTRYDLAAVPTILNINTNNTISLGRNQGGLYYKGGLSDVHLYATALSADDILKLYKLGNV